MCQKRLIMITKPKGTYDLLPSDTKNWVKLESILRSVCKVYNYKEIRTPIFESSDLFHRSVGETSDLVSKETYDFKDRGDRNITLRPEGTAGVVRSYIENKLFGDQSVQKLFYMGPIFRYERPQKGRQRQFHQFGVEALGSSSPLLDAEVIALGVSVIKALGLKGVKVRINSIGDIESRELYRTALVNYFTKYSDDICGDCKIRLEKNPLRILDCKVDNKKEFFVNAPKMSDYLNEVSKNHFNKVIECLESMGIEYEVNPYLVRGLDYYSHTVFEVEAAIEGFGAQNVLCGGGRYDDLVDKLDGPKTCAVGMAFGMERLLLACEAEEKVLGVEDSAHLFIIALGDNARVKATALANKMRLGGLITEIDYQDKALKGQFKSSDRVNAKYTAILGDTELEKNVINVKDNSLKTEETICIDDLYKHILTNIQASKKSACNGCKKEK